MFNFEIHSDFQDVADKFKETLSATQIRSVLATTLNACQRNAKKMLTEHAKIKYNFSEELFTKENLYRIKRARADKDQMTATAFVSSKPISMRTFVVANAPVAVYITKRSTIKNAFIVNAQAAGAAKAIGVFIRDESKSKYAPIKGVYAGRRIKSGDRKGELIKRHGIEKKYTISTADVADSGSASVIERIEIVKDFDKRLDKLVKKLAKKAATG